MVKITATHLDELGEEKPLFTRIFKTTTEADDYMDEHEQDFADEPSIYAIYREEINNG